LKVFASNHFENYLFATLKAVDSLFRQFRWFQGEFFFLLPL
jgi:hypothetical protein